MQRDEFGYLFTTGQMMDESNPLRAAQLTREEFLRSPGAAAGGPNVISDPSTVLARLDANNNKATAKFVADQTAGNTPSQSVSQA